MDNAEAGLRLLLDSLTTSKESVRGTRQYLGSKFLREDGACVCMYVCAYNGINGYPMCMSPLINAILRDKYDLSVGGRVRVRVHLCVSVRISE